MSEKAGLIFANFNRNCDCGEKVEASFIGMDEDTQIECPACGDDLSLDVEEFDDIAFQFEDAVIALFEKAGLGRPSRDIIDFIQKHNRAPTADDLRKTKGYAVALVGEEYWQPAISQCAIGERITLFRETDNPHDNGAIVAVDPRGNPVGHIARKNFVYRVVNDQEKGCTAEIFRLVDERGFREIVLDVEVSDEELATRAYQPRAVI